MVLRSTLWTHRPDCESCPALPFPALPCPALGWLCACDGSGGVWAGRVARLNGLSLPLLCVAFAFFTLPPQATVTEATPDAAASGDEQTPRRHRFLMLASLFRGWGERRARVTAETEESQSTSRPPSQSPSHLGESSLADRLPSVFPSEPEKSRPYGACAADASRVRPSPGGSSRSGGTWWHREVSDCRCRSGQGFALR